MPKGIPNKRYTPEFKKLVVETMQEEKLSYSETCRRFEVNSRDQIKSWERIYLTEGPEGLAIERRGRGSAERAVPEAQNHYRHLHAGGELYQAGKRGWSGQLLAQGSKPRGADHRDGRHHAGQAYVARRNAHCQAGRYHQH